MIIRNKAFTLTELLLALAIVGAIAGLTIPGMMKDVNTKNNISQLKNTVNIIELAITNEMTNTRTSDVTNTIFNSPDTVFQAFDTTRVCTDADKDKCWNTGQYKFVNRTTQATWTPGTTYAIFKNGTTLSYSRNNGGTSFPSLVGTFYIDLNGEKGPNIIGRDAFAIYLTKKGKLQGFWGDTNNTTLETTRNAINNDGNMSGVATSCFNYLTMNNWVMDY